jgi:phage-related protein
MTIIGSAYVDIRAITDHLESDIKRVLATLPDKIEVNVDANTKAAEDQIDLLVAWADLHKVDITVDADTSAAEAEIAAAAHNADVKINVDADTAAAKVHMDAFVAEEDARHINVPVDVDDAVARTKFGSMIDTLTKISNFKPFALFDSKAIEEAKKKAEDLGQEFKAPFIYNLSTKAAETSLDHLKTSAGNVDKFLRLLSGAPQLVEMTNAAIDAKVKLGEHAITVAMVAERYAAMSSGALYAAGNILSLGSSVVQLTGLFAAFPGVFVGFEIASKITGLAFSDMKKAVPDLQKEFQHLKDTIAQNFWDTARQGFEDLFIRSHTLGDQLDITAKSVGGFWGAMTEGMSKGSFAKAMIGDFTNLDNGIKIVTASSGTFLHIFQTLGEFGSAYIPKLAQGFDNVAVRFDAFLTKANSDGTLKRWVDNGVESFKGLVSAITNTSAVIGGLMKAAVDAGGASLGIFGGAMEKLAAVINKPEVQANLVNLFSGANLAIGAVTQGLSVFMGAIGFLSPALKVVLTDSGKVIQIFLDIIGGVLTNVEVFKGLQDMFTGVVHGIGAFSTVIGPLGDKLGTLFTVVGMVADSLGHVFASALTAVLPVVKTLLSGIEPLIKPLGEITTAIVNAVVPALKILVDVAFPPLIDLLVNDVFPAFKALIPVLGTMLPPIVSAFSKAIADLAPVIGHLIPVVVPVIGHLLEVGSHAIPVILAVIVPLIEGFAKLLDKVVPLIDPILKVADGFLKMNGAGPVLVGFLTAGALGIAAFNGAIKITKGLFDGAKLAVEAYGIATKVAGWLSADAAGEVGAMDIALGIFEGILDALGIGLIILAIVGLVAAIVLLISHWNEVTKVVGDFIGAVGKNLGDFFKQTGGMFKDFFTNTVGMFVDFFNHTVGMFVDFFNNTVGMVVDWGKRTIGMFKDFGTNTFGMFKDFFTNTVGMFKDFFDTVINGFKGFAKDPIGEVKKFISTIEGDIIKWGVSVLINITKFLTDVNNNIRKWALDAVLGFAKFVQDSVRSFIQFGIDAYNAFNKFVKDTKQAILNWAASIVSGIIKFNTDTLGMIIDWVKNTVGMFQDFAKKAPQAIIDFAASVITTIAKWNKDSFGMVLDFIKNTIGMFQDFGKNLENFFTTMCLDIVNGFISWFAGLIGMFTDYYKSTTGDTHDFITTTVGMFVDFFKNTVGMFTDFFNNTVGMFRDMWTNIGNAVLDGIAKVAGFMAKIGGAISDAIGDPGTILQRAGQAIMDGFLNGLKGAFQGVKDFIGGIGDWIAKNKGPEAYDRALLIPHGGWIIGGLQKGIEGSMGSLKNTLSGVTDMISSAVSSNIAVNVGGGSVPGSNPNVFARASSAPVDMFAAAANMQRGNGIVTSPTVNVYPSAPLNEEQVGRMAATEMYWQLLNH